jgi:hypothetical protein
MAIDKNNAKPATSVQLKAHHLEVLEEIQRVIEAPPRDLCLPGQHRGPDLNYTSGGKPQANCKHGQAGPSAGMV